MLCSIQTIVVYYYVCLKHFKQPIMLNALKKYFKENSREKILDDWNSIEISNISDSPTIGEFLAYHPLQGVDWEMKIPMTNLFSKIKNPSFTSDFLFYTHG